MKAFKIVLITGMVPFLFFSKESGLSRNSKHEHYFKGTFPGQAIKNQIQTGDVILRSGKGFISDVFRQFSLIEKKFSHAGIISVEQNKIFVYHILGGTKPNSQMKKEPLDFFCDPKENNSFAVYRYNLTNEEKTIMIDHLQSLFRKNILFDSHFDLLTDSAMYCTELVYKVVSAAAGNQQYLSSTNINGNKYIAPDNLYLNRHAALIYSHTY